MCVMMVVSECFDSPAVFVSLVVFNECLLSPLVLLWEVYQ